MKTLKIIAVLVLALVVLVGIGQILPRPTPPPPGQIVHLSSGMDVNVYQKNAEGADSTQANTAQTIVLVHGLPGSAHDWPEMVDELVARGFNVVWYDRVGYGHSSRRKAGDPHTMQVNGQELDELIAAMDLGHPALVGWSFGGGTVQASQSARHADTPFIVLMAAIAPAMGTDNKPADIPGTKLIMRTPILGKISTKMIVRARFADPVSKRWINGVHAVLVMPGSVDTMRAEMEQINPDALKPSNINTPALVVHGRKDKLVFYDVGVDLSERLPNGELFTLDEAGHMLPMTFPEQIADAIKSFADKQVKNAIDAPLQ
jgi:non-heme chloroperoxidase